MASHFHRDLAAVNEHNNNVGPINQPLTVSPREESMLVNMLNNLTRSRAEVMKHIAGAAPELRSNLYAIQYGISLLMEKYDGHTTDIYRTADFQKLAKQVFGFISEQSSGRKLFCVTVSSPTMGPSTHYFAYYLTSRAVKPEDIKLMVPFLDSLTDESNSIAEIEIDNEANNLAADETVHKTEVKPPAPPAYMAPTSLPIVPFSPISAAEGRKKPVLVRQKALVKQSTETEEAEEELEDAHRPKDQHGFWMDNNSEFSIELSKPNASDDAKQGKCDSDPYIVPGNQYVSESTAKILNEIFETETLVNCPVLEPATPPQPEASVSAANLELPQEVLDITPIVTTPAAVKKAHKNAKSRLSGRKGSRQQNQVNQRRNSFGQLPNNSVNNIDVAEVNLTVPISSNLNQTLEQIMSRLSNLETSLKKNVSQKKSRNYHSLPYRNRK